MFVSKSLFFFLTQEEACKICDRQFGNYRQLKKHVYRCKRKVRKFIEATQSFSIFSSILSDHSLTGTIIIHTFRILILNCSGVHFDYGCWQLLDRPSVGTFASLSLLSLLTPSTNWQKYHPYLHRASGSPGYGTQPLHWLRKQNRPKRRALFSGWISHNFLWPLRII